MGSCGETMPDEEIRMTPLKPMRLTIIVEFLDGLSDLAQQDVKQEVHDLKDRLYLGKIVKAELVALKHA